MDSRLRTVRIEDGSRVIALRAGFFGMVVPMKPSREHVGDEVVLRLARCRDSFLVLRERDGTIATVIRDVPPVLRHCNQSVERFNGCMDRVKSCWPFYGKSDEMSCRESSIRLRDALLAIDETALVRDGFWSSLVEDVDMGNLYEEWVKRDGFDHGA